MKKYFVSNQECFASIRRNLIIVDEKDIEEKVEMAGLISCTDVNDLTTYRDHSGDFDGIGLESAAQYTALDRDQFAQAEKELIWGAWGAETEEEKELEKSIIGKMKAEGFPVNEIEVYKVYSFWDGHNWEEKCLDYYGHDVDWEDYSEEFEGMQEIDFERYNTGDMTLYRLQDESLILVDNSYYEGGLWEVAFINDTDVKDIASAIKYIDEKEYKRGFR